jgi:lipopolysaccharide assembly outer membrane protein LptD (OstA)
MFSQKISKFVALIFMVFITLVCLTTSLNVNALDTIKPDNSGNVNNSEPKTNLTVAGSQVDISGKTNKDLIVAGGNVSITGDIERNLIAAGGNLNIQSKKIGATVRIAGGNINLKNTVIE